MRTLILILLLPALALAGPHNYGPAAADASPLLSHLGLTTSGTTPTARYPIGRDSNVVVDVDVEAAAASATITLTAEFEAPGGNLIGYPAQELPLPSAHQIVWKQATGPTAFHWSIPTNGECGTLAINAVTSDNTNSTTVSASALGR
jgi:hypothetical protein